MATAPSLALVPAARQRLVDSVARRPLVPALVLTAVLTLLRLRGGVESDVWSQLWIAAKINAGAELYRDIIEINPPLWFWMAVPIDRAASLFHVPPDTLLIAVFGLLVAASIAATNRLIGNLPPLRRTLFLTYLALILLGMPWLHVGQREQIVLIGAVPYAALVACRRENWPVPRHLAVAVGVGAALGFALKHYFLFAPALLELWLLSANPRRWRPVRPETLAVAGVGIAYAAALLAEHDYLATMVPLLRLAYGDFGPHSFNLFGPYAIAAVAISVLLAANARAFRDGHAPVASALLVAAIAFTASYCIQFKGWPYQSLPLIGCFALALGALLAETASPSRSLRIFAPALLAAPLVLSANESSHAQRPGADLVESVAGLREGDPVTFLTTDTSAGVIAVERGLDNPSRYNGIWMMQAVVYNELRGNPNPRVAAFGRQVVADTVQDFRCRPPKRIIAPYLRPSEQGWDILAYFDRNADFARLLTHYRVRSRTSYVTFEHVTPLEKPLAPCLRGLMPGAKVSHSLGIYR